MKKIIFLLCTIILVLTLPGCKKLVEGLIPPIPTDSIPTDPTITDIGTPVGTLVTKVIGKTGGSIASSDGNAELIFPASALDDNTTISVQAVSQTAPNGVGYAYKFLPDGIQFKQPVTLKFHYTADDLAATLGDLMGIAFQDNIGGWWRVTNFTNDTVNKIISAPIKHFTAYTQFDVLMINPPRGELKVNNSMGMQVDLVGSDDDLVKQLGPQGDEDLAPLITLRNTKVIWSVNGVVNGKPDVGTITGSTSSTDVSFKAPSKVPKPNIAAVSAQVDVKFKYGGKIFDKTSLVSNIKIIDGEKYLLEVRETQTADPFKYTDTASLTVLVSSSGVVTIDDISNFHPEINMETASLGDCTATWIEDNVGETNIIGVTGTITNTPNSQNRELILQFQHSGTVTPKFHRVCPGDDATEGGIPIQGYPILLSFTLTPNGGIYFTDDGEEFARLTLQD